MTLTIGYILEKRYSTNPKYAFLSFATKCGYKYGKKLMDIATKIGIDAAKTAPKRVVQKQQKLQEI